MQFIFTEYKNDYASYTFSYEVHCLLDHEDEVAEAYDKGFLPASTFSPDSPPRFYLARSLRVNLASYAPSSENRRVDRKIAALGVEMEITEKAAFDFTEAVQAFCLDYAQARYEKGNMTKERLETLWRHPLLSHIFTFSVQGKMVGILFAVLKDNTFHYWFSFFDLSYLAYGLGKWMMWRAIDWAKQEKMDYVYLGTCYHKKSLYKVRDFKGIEFFEKESWSGNSKRIKELCALDELVG